MIPYWQYALGLAALVAAWILRKRAAQREFSQFENLPFVKFEDGDDTPARYAKDSRSLLHKGYVKYLKAGVPFRMRNPVDPDHPQVLLPFTYLDRVKKAATDEMSFHLFSRQAFLLDYINAPTPTDAATQIVRVDLNKNLGSLIAGMHVEADNSFQKHIPKCPEWTSFHPYMTFAHTTSHMTSLALAGPEMCRNQDWQDVMVLATMSIFQTAGAVRAKYPRWLRWIAPWVDPGARQIYQTRRRCAELLRPSHQRRMAGMRNEKTGERFEDGTKWMIDVPSPSSHKTVEQVADNHWFLAIASIHSTSASMLSVLYDLLDRPESMAEILEEIRVTRLESGCERWSKQTLQKLEKLDSFMKESQRVHPVGMVSVVRSAVQPFTFDDGLRIPANTQCAFANEELNHDGELHPDPDTFDAHRSLKLRHEVDPLKFQFANLSEDTSINFGAGPHACPGRQFATAEMKIMLCGLLMKYELKWPEGKEGRPPNMVQDFSNTPNPMAEILIRERRGGN